MSDNDIVLRTIDDCVQWLKDNDAPTDAAYDGSYAPAKRDLTPRERDVLCRILKNELKRLEEEEAGIRARLAAGEDLGPFIHPGMNNVDRVMIHVIRDVLDPRRDYPRCEWCDEHECDHRNVGEKPMSAYLGPEVDGDGQPTTIHVAYAAGHHVGEGEVEFVRRALRQYKNFEPKVYDNDEG